MISILSLSNDRIFFDLSDTPIKTESWGSYTVQRRPRCEEHRFSVSHQPSKKLISHRGVVQRVNTSPFFVLTLQGKIEI